VRGSATARAADRCQRSVRAVASVRVGLPTLLAERSPRERAAFRRRLEGLCRRLDRRYLDTDPLAHVHSYRSDADREIVGFLAAGLAFGNVVAIRASLSKLLAAMGRSPSLFVDAFDEERSGGALRGLYHRWVRAEDFAALFRTLRLMRSRSGSIGAFFMEGHRPDDQDIGASLASFSERALAMSRGVGDGPVESGAPARTGSESSARARSASPARRGAAFFPSPRDGSACKRLCLFLRWMVRDGDGLDLGLAPWRGVPRRQLVLPLDTHLARLSRALGLTRRRAPGWKMAVEATRALALLDPEDPVKYDFSLSRIGILDLCLHGRDPLDCRACPAPRPRIRRSPSSP
jgi:uncharacterized protein (TIGR02757 family)